MKLQVIKRDGHKEPFSIKKIERVVAAAGLTPPQVHALGETLGAWAKLQKGPLTSLQVRDRVLLELKAVDPYAANMYDWYQKTKDNK